MVRRLLKRAAQSQAYIAVALDALQFPAGENNAGPKWVEVTREGNFPGYLGGLKPFAFTRADLESMVANIRAHPSFKLDAQGTAIGQVIPWDFNHASEINPAQGDLPVAGAPAQAWTLDLQVRPGADGKAELWALTQFLEPGRTYVQAGQYKWASVAVTFNAIHPESGQNVGAMVTSIAMTNTPFIEGMSELAASRRSNTNGAVAVEARRNFFEAAEDAADAIHMMRDLFGLPETAGAAEVMTQIAIVQGWVTSGTAPLGTDPEHIIGSLRTILNLPTLTPQVGVLQEAGMSIQALIEEQATGVGVPGAPGTGDDGMVPPPPPVAASRQQKQDGAIMEEFIKVLASLLGVRQSEDAVLAAVKDGVQLRSGMVEAFGLNRDGLEIILAAGKEGAQAREQLLGLFGALGIEDPDAAADKIAEVMQSAATLKEVMPELEGLRVEKKKMEETVAEADVDAAIAACKLHPSMKGALLLQRTTDPEGFAKSFPPNAAPANGKKNLLKRVAASGATPLRTSADGSSVQLGGGGNDDAASDDLGGGSDTINLAHYPGSNPTARAKAYLASTNPNWNELDNEAQFLQAVHLKKRPNVIDQATA